MRIPVRVLLLPGLVMMWGCSTERPGSAGLRDGRLAPCPETPNCVCSQFASPDHHVEPLRYTDTAVEARGRLIDIVNALPRSRWVAQEEAYLHAEVRSRIFRFVDDLEFLFPDQEKVVHVRSAARAGSSDLGVNRKRVELIRTRFEGTGI